jgi:PKD repeat protein
MPAELAGPADCNQGRGSMTRRTFRLSVFLIAGALLGLCSTAWCLDPGVLAVSCVGGGAAGQTFNCSWSGTLIPPPVTQPPCDVRVTGWSAAAPTASIFLGSGDTFSFTPQAVAQYETIVKIYYYAENARPADPPCGNAGSGQSQTWVYAPPLLIGSLATTPASPIVDQPTSFVAGAPYPNTPTTWSWNFGDGGSCTDCYFGPHTYTQPGTYTVHLAASNPAGATSGTYTVTVAPDPPRITFMDYGPAPVIPTAGTPLQFTSDFAGDARDRTILWDFGDGTTSFEQNPLHTFPAPDFYNVTLYLTNAWGTTLQTELVVVQAAAGGAPPPSASFTYSPSTPVTNQTVTFQGTAAGAVTRWRWDFGDGTPIGFGQSVTHTFTQANQYSVQMSAANAYGQVIVEKILNVFRNDVPPVANFLWSPLSPVVGQLVQFNDLSAGATSWSWNFGDGGTSTAQNPTHAYTSAGDKPVVLTVRNGFGSDSKTLTLGCGTGNVLAANFRWDPPSPVAGQAVNFIDTSTGSPDSWLWSIGFGFTTTAQNPTHTFDAPGDYVVTLLITKGLATNSVTQTVHVANGTALTADFSISPNPPVQGKPVTFQDTSTGNPTQWAWTFSDGFVSNLAGFTRTLNGPGPYTVDLSISRDDGQTGFRSKGFDLIVRPTASFKVSATPVVSQPVTFTDTSQGSPTTWNWSIGNQSISTQKSFSYTFTAVGSAAVSLTVTNDAGSDSTVQTFDVQDKPASQRPAITNLNGSGGPCLFQGYAMSLPFTASVDWRTDQPAVLDVLLDGANHSLIPATASGASFTVDTSQFKGGAPVEDNTVTVTAMAANQDASDPVTQHFYSLLLDTSLDTKVVRDSQSFSVISTVGVPAAAWEAKVDVPGEVPVFGGYPVGITDFQIKFEETYKNNCTYASSITGGGAVTGAGVTAGMSIFGTGTRTISTTGGISSSGTASIGAEGSLAFSTKATPIVSLIPAMTAPCKLPVISRVCDVLTVTGTAGGTFGGQLNFTFDDRGNVQYKDATMTGKLAADVKATAEVKPAKVEVFGGGNFGMTASLTQPYFRGASASLEFGARARVYSYAIEEKASYTCNISATGATCGTAGGFAPAAFSLHRVPTSDAGSSEVLGDGNPIILSNLGSLAASASAARSDRTLVVYLGVNAAANSASPQRLDLRYVTRQGTSAWSSPKPVTNDLTGDFDPALVFSTTGRAVVAWERLHDNSLTDADIQSVSDLPKLYGQMEIAAATYDPSADTWSPLQMLTSNELFDHSPALTALADGRVVLAWIRESADGTGDQQIAARILQGDTWSAEQIIASGLRSVGTLSLASQSNDVQLVFGRDTAISQLTFHANVWSSLSDLTSDTAANSSATAAYDSDGTARVLWLRDGSIVSKRLPDGAIETVRGTTAGGSVVNPVLTVTPAGVDLVTWLDRGDVFGRVRDAQSGLWSGDIPMTQGSEGEGRLAVLFDADNALHLIGLRGNADAVIDLVDVRHPLRVDLTAVPGSMSAMPAKPAASAAVTLAADLRNSGDLPVRDVPVVLVRGRAATAAPEATSMISGLWMPGETRHITFNSIYDASKPAYTIAIDPSGASGDATLTNNSIAYSFANQPPSACIQASAVSGNAPLSISLDSSCSNDPDGSIATQTWVLSDGTVATTPGVAHTFMTEGTYTVSLQVMDDMGATAVTTKTIVVSRPARRHAASLP